MNLPPVLVELFKLLPPPDAEWPVEERVTWMRAAVALFDLLYGPAGIVVEMIPPPPRALLLLADLRSAVKEEGAHG